VKSSSSRSAAWLSLLGRDHRRGPRAPDDKTEAVIRELEAQHSMADVDVGQ
jgi:hypothetical protein